MLLVLCMCVCVKSRRARYNHHTRRAAWIFFLEFFGYMLLALSPVVPCGFHAAAARHTMNFLHRNFLSDCRMIFPLDQTQPFAPQSRNERMASLLGDLVDAADDQAMSKAILTSSTQFLLQPFIGIPEPGSIYGDAGATLNEKIKAYGDAMEQRVARARKSGGERQAIALELLAAHVLRKTRTDLIPGERGG